MEAVHAAHDVGRMAIEAKTTMIAALESENAALKAKLAKAKAVVEAARALSAGAPISNLVSGRMDLAELRCALASLDGG